MFSGIIKEVGEIVGLEEKAGMLHLKISTAKIKNIELGDSIAVNGCCQTVTKFNDDNGKIIFEVQAAKETLDKTNLSELKVNSKINLESSLEFGGKIDGHLVSGHIDCVGKVLKISSEEGDENTIFEISLPKDFRKFVAPKGSITVNGISLTVINVSPESFTFTLIPFSRENTNLGVINEGESVNIEVDLVSRYLVNYMENRGKTI